MIFNILQLALAICVGCAVLVVPAIYFAPERPDLDEDERALQAELRRRAALRAEVSACEAKTGEDVRA